MRANWKLIIFDALILTYIGLNIYQWNDLSDLKKFMYATLSILWLVRQVDEHISFYKKHRRFY